MFAFWNLVVGADTGCHCRVAARCLWQRGRTARSTKGECLVAAQKITLLSWVCVGVILPCRPHKTPVP